MFQLHTTSILKQIILNISTYELRIDFSKKRVHEICFPFIQRREACQAYEYSKKKTTCLARENRMVVLPLGLRGKTVHVRHPHVPTSQRRGPPVFFPTPSHPTHALLRSDRRGQSRAEERNLERSLRRPRRGGGRGTRAPQGPLPRRSSSTGSGSSKERMTVFSGDETAPFFGFLGAAAALVFSCTWPPPLRPPLLCFLLSHCFFPNLFEWGEKVGDDPFVCSDLTRFRDWLYGP